MAELTDDQRKKITWIERRAAALTDTEKERLGAAWRAGLAERDAAGDVVLHASWETGIQKEAMDAGDAARAAAEVDMPEDSLTDAGFAAGDMAWATALEGIVGQHGLTQAHVDALRAPWISTVGEG